MSREQVSDAYAQGWLLVHYFFSTDERKEKLLQYLTSLSKGEKNNEETWQKSTGMTFVQTDAVLREYKRKPISYRKITYKPKATPAISVQVLPKGAGERIVFGERLRRIGGSDRDAGALSRARQMLAKSPSDGFVKLLAARAEIAFGDAARGRELANAVAQSEPENAEAHYLVGLSLMEEGRKDETVRAQKFKEARPYFAKAFKRDPNHVGALYQTGLSLMETGNMNENTANVFLLAHQLAPQVGEISISTASALVSLGKREEAIALLQPVANNPHASKLSEQAQAMIDGLQGAAPSASEAAAPAPG